MSAPVESSKVCAICGEDCSSKPRTKDARGRYYCKECYDSARRRTEEPEPSLIDLAIESLPPAISAPPTACPSCGRAMRAGAILCTNCGYDAKVGYRVPMPSAIQTAVQKSAPWFLSPVYLFVRPRTFFRNFVDSPPALTALFAWIFGVAGAIDRLDSRLAIAQVSGRNPPIKDDWSVYWGIALVGGILAGAIYYSIGGWWYRVRLGWSGEKDADVNLVRRVYILASMVYAVPAIFATAIDTLRYASPMAAGQGNLTFIDMFVLICVFWSIWNSFVGVRTVFETKLAPAIIWFLVIPVGFYALLFGGVASLVFFLSSMPADLKHPKHFRSSTFNFAYPGNWEIDDKDPHYDPNGNVYVGPRFQNAAMQLVVYESDESIEAELNLSIDGLRDQFHDIQEAGRINEWGQHKGSGRILSTMYEGAQIRMTVFVADLGSGRILEVLETVAVGDQKEVDPGFEFIRSRFTVY